LSARVPQRTVRAGAFDSTSVIDMAPFVWVPFGELLFDRLTGDPYTTGQFSKS
jgi:hypothetical protein